MQNIFTITKISALLGLIILGFIVGIKSPAWQMNLNDFWTPFKYTTLSNITSVTPLSKTALLSAFGLAMIGPIFSSSAWNTITYTAAEIKNPKRNIPLSLFLGTLFVSILYLSANLVYLMLLPAKGIPNGVDTMAKGIAFAANDRVGTAAAEMIFGQIGVAVMAIFIMISTFGCNNGLVLSGARVYYAMAKDGVFFPSAAEINPVSNTPNNALWIQGIWACLLVLSGTFDQLTDMLIFAAFFFYGATAVGVFILRVREPNTERPYKVWGYPFVPAIFIAFCVALIVITCFTHPREAGFGLVLMATGIPFYLYWNKK